MTEKRVQIKLEVSATTLDDLRYLADADGIEIGQVVDGLVEEIFDTNYDWDY